MASNCARIGTLAGRSVVVRDSWIFTFPTRLMSAWQPKMLEIFRPGYTLERPEIGVICGYSTTEDLDIRVSNPARRLYRTLSAPITFNELPVLDTRFETDSNIAHLLTLVLPKILAFQRIQGNCAVVLRKNASEMGRSFFRTLNIPFICTDRHVIANLVRTDETVQGAFEGWYSDLFSDLRFAGEVRNTPERIFICRKAQRRIINEDAVETFLNAYGFRKVYFEDIPIGQQWSWLRNAKEVVAVHGAGMAALLFSLPGVKVVEIFHPGFVNDIYRNMVAGLGGAWCGVTGRLTSDTVRKLDYGENPHALAMSSFEVDTNSVKQALTFLEIY